MLHYTNAVFITRRHVCCVRQKSDGLLDKCFFEAVVTHRTNRQVTLAVKVLGKEVKRGLNFMEVMLR